MKGILTTVAVVAVAGGAYWLWKKYNTDEEVEIPEEEAETM